MRIAVVGAGALGGYYGARLCRAGAEVHLLLRTDYDAVRERGLRIKSPDGDFTVFPHAHCGPDTIGICDLVLVSLKTTANDQYQELLDPLINSSTAILCLQNGLGNCEQLAALFGKERVLAGLCFVCLNRAEPGVVQHQGFGKIVLGEFNQVAQPRTREIAEIFKQSGVSCEVVDELDEGLWEKLVWNIPFNGLGVAASAGPNALESGKIPEVLGHAWTTDRLLADTGWEERIRELMREIINIAAAKNIGLKPELADRMINNTRSMGAYRPSTVIDFEQGRPFELESMFLEPLRQARAASVSVPRLEALCIVLKKLASYLPRP